MKQIKTKHFYEPHFLATELFRVARASYDHGSPWTVQQFYEDIKSEFSDYFLIETDAIIGFLGYHTFLDEIEIYNFCVADNYQKNGYGTILFRELDKRASEEPFRRILLEVRRSNQSARRFYLKKGFVEMSQRKDYYASPVEDALVMVKKVGT